MKNSHAFAIIGLLIVGAVGMHWLGVHWYELRESNELGSHWYPYKEYSYTYRSIDGTTKEGTLDDMLREGVTFQHNHEAAHG